MVGDGEHFPSVQNWSLGYHRMNLSQKAPHTKNSGTAPFEHHTQNPQKYQIKNHLINQIIKINPITK
jgi:hypothetical protein